jgi:exodeoxyribonuclease X
MSATAIILDTETTGFDEPDVIELAWAGPLAIPNVMESLTTEFNNVRYKPRKPISVGAMAAHHILDEDLAGEPEWPGSWSPPIQVDYLIGHNVDYDWSAVGKPDIKRICTLALARRLWEDADSHSVSGLLYHLNPTVRPSIRQMLKSAHSAASDVLFCTMILAKILELLPKATDWDYVYRCSEKARIPHRFTFGKYGPKDGKQGRLIADIRKEDPGYIQWMLRQDDFANDAYLSKALRGEA